MSMAQRHCIFEDEPIRTTMRRLKQTDPALTLVVLNRKGEVSGTLTDGDIRTHLSRLKPRLALDDPAVKFMRREPMVAQMEKDGALFGAMLRAESGRRRRGIRIIPAMRDNRLLDVLDLTDMRHRPLLDVLVTSLAIRGSEINAAKRRREIMDAASHRAHLKRLEALAGVRARDIKRELPALSRAGRVDQLYTTLARGIDWLDKMQYLDAVNRLEYTKVSRTLRTRKKVLLRWVMGGREGGQPANTTSGRAPFVVVLGCKDRQTLNTRVKGAAELLRECGAQLPEAVVLSGGGKRSDSTEAQLMEERLGTLSARLHAESWKRVRILKEEDSLDTVGNAVLTRMLLAQEGLSGAGRRRPQRVIVVTSNYHAARAAWIFRRVFGSGIRVHSVRPRGNPSAQDLRTAEEELDSEHRVNTETFAIPNYLTGEMIRTEDEDVLGMFYQMLLVHPLYRNRSDLARKYSEAVRSLRKSAGQTNWT